MKTRKQKGPKGGQKNYGDDAVAKQDSNVFEYTKKTTRRIKVPSSLLKLLEKLKRPS